jgi:DNA repair exonuclease SbcCD ATPase subunit
LKQPWGEIMLIEKIELSNFGIHRDISFEPGKTGNVVGLLGSNGSGKSTILEALKYAFTGDLNGTLESYKSVNTEDNGQVTVKFIKDGVKGKISRQVGKGRLKTSFKWGDDKIVTAKKSVDTKLEEILSVDKKALANAIFLPQGRLDSLLFGTKTEREELFVKLVNMSYCQRRSEILALKSKQLKSDMTDMVATIAEAKRNMVVSERDQTSLLNELADLKDYSKDIQILRNKEKLDNDISTNVMYLTEEQASLTLLKEDIVNTENGLKAARLATGYDEATSFEDVIIKQKEKYNDLINQRTTLVNNLNKFQNYEKLKQKLQVAETDIASTEVKLNELFSKKIIPVVSTKDLDNLKTQLGELKFEAEQIEKWRNKLVAFLDKEVSSATCPVCQTEAHEGYLQDLPEFDTLVKRKQTALKALQTTLDSQTELYSNYNAELVSHNAKLEQTTFQLGNYHEEKARLIKELEDYKDLDPLTKPNKDTLDALQNSLTELAQKNENFYEAKTNWVNISSNAVKAQQTVDKLKASLNELNKILADQEEDLENTSELPLTELEARQSLRGKTTGKLEQAMTSLHDATARLLEFEQRRQKDERTLEITKDLDSLADIFARKGLPREYVNMKFIKLMDATQDHLDILNADFTITCDEEDPLSFKFQRHDGVEHVELPMSKLSGGQRVRLCTAFLLACQKELVSDVGLMTFDEPSTHLDNEGVGNLQTLFEKLQALFKESEYQIWISDHHPDLEKSFNKTLKLP